MTFTLILFCPPLLEALPRFFSASFFVALSAIYWTVRIILTPPYLFFSPSWFFFSRLFVSHPFDKVSSSIIDGPLFSIFYTPMLERFHFYTLLPHVAVKLIPPHNSSIFIMFSHLPLA